LPRAVDQQSMAASRGNSANISRMVSVASSHTSIRVSAATDSSAPRMMRA